VHPKLNEIDKEKVS